MTWQDDDLLREMLDEAPSGRLSSQAKELFTGYTGAGYLMVNRVLKYGKLPPSGPWRNYYDMHGGDLFKDSTATKIQTILNWAQIMQDAIHATPGQARIVYRTAPDKEIKTVKKVRQTLTATSFVSTSRSFRETVKFWEDGQSRNIATLYRLIVPASAKSIYVDPFSRNKGEQEVILPYGTKITVTSLAPVNGTDVSWMGEHTQMTREEADLIRKVIWARRGYTRTGVTKLITATVSTPPAKIPGAQVSPMAAARKTCQYCGAKIVREEGRPGAPAVWVDTTGGDVCDENIGGHAPRTRPV